MKTTKNTPKLKDSEPWVKSAEAVGALGIHRQSLATWFREGAPWKWGKKGARGARPKMVQIKALKAWALEHGKTVKMTLPSPDPVPESKAGDPIEAEGLEGSLLRIRQAELQAHNEWQKTSKGSDGLATKAQLAVYAACHKQLVDAEKAVAWKQGEIEAAWQEWGALVKERSAPLRAYIENLPFALGARLNPTDPEFAEKALRLEIQSVLLPMLAGRVKS
jgi:hypothetical protein